MGGHSQNLNNDNDIGIISMDSIMDNTLTELTISVPDRYSTNPVEFLMGQKKQKNMTY